MPITGPNAIGPLKPKALRIPAAVQYSGLSRSVIYRLHRDDKIIFLKSGRSTLVDVESLDRILETMKAA